MTRSHEELRSLVPAYVLGAVSEDELREVRDHIVSCDECLAEADGYAEAAASLALAAPVEAPPAGFADRVVESATGGVPQRAPARRRAPWWVRLGAAAGAAALVAVGALWVDARNDLAAQRELVASLLRADDGVRLRGGGAVAVVVPAEDGAVFVVDGLDAAPDGRDYQLWFLDGGEPASAGVFDVSGDVAVVETGRSLDGVEGAAVTVEPDGGSPQPTTDPIVVSG